MNTNAFSKKHNYLQKQHAQNFVKPEHDFKMSK